MQKKDTFSEYHPLVNLLYFGLIFGFSMFLMHPVCLAISFICAVCYMFYLNGKKAVRILICYALPLLLLTAVINPAFNHQGSMILCYLPTGNPLTLESIIYGIAAGVMLVSVILWFSCYTSVMTSDKFVYLFGRIIPSLSLVISMTLRFVPRFKAQLENVKEAQNGIRQNAYKENVLNRMKNAINCLSIMVTWSLENAIDTADSMKSRGYGLKRRTAFSIYTFTERDKYAFIWLCFCGIYLISGIISGNLYWKYFPDINGMIAKPMTISLYIVYSAMSATPLIINYREEKKWKSLRSKI
ncbi:MAG: energy-coupling factor transporter transmembrane protein EcfT [Clostridium sp.]|nr:energy-coupling factor transporter transmembrane protein EcfT [Clostridium sp.]